MAIEDGSTASADEVMNAFGLIFDDSANLIWNADLIGFDSDLEQEWNNIEWDTMQDNTEIDTAGDYDYIPIVGGDVIDNFSDNSIDATLWSTSGTVTESGAKLIIGATHGTHSATLDGASATDFNNQDYRFIVNGNFNAVTGGGGANTKTYIVDESANEVELSSQDTNGVFATLRLDMEPDTNNVQVYSNALGSGGGTAKDVSSLVDGDAWHIKFQTYGQFPGDNSVIELQWTQQTKNVITNNDLISTTNTSASTITNAILAKSDGIEGSSTITYALSADNGSNYETVTPNEIHRFTNTGTQLKVKTTLTSSASAQVPLLYHTAVKYNLY